MGIIADHAVLDIVTMTTIHTPDTAMVPVAQDITIAPIVPIAISPIVPVAIPVIVPIAIPLIVLIAIAPIAETTIRNRWQTHLFQLDQ